MEYFWLFQPFSFESDGNVVSGAECNQARDYWGFQCVWFKFKDVGFTAIVVLGSYSLWRIYYS